MFKVVITDHSFSSVSQESIIIENAGAKLQVARSAQPEELIQEIHDADALLVQWARLDATLLASMKRCRIIVRYGIGVDNIDLAAAKALGIAVCNVPDYGIDEVADHTVSMALSLGRQLPELDERTRDGIWKMAPIRPMPAFRHMIFATAGFGRIARAVLDRARGFKFKLAAYDPFVVSDAFATAGVISLELDELFKRADILSLHLPLTQETQHFVSEKRLATMKPTAILINTARGPLIDEVALASALQNRTISAAGLDVFVTEPLDQNHALRKSSHSILTPHIAWYSEQSMPTLQRKAAEEIVRALKNEPLLNRVA